MLLCMLSCTCDPDSISHNSLCACRVAGTLLHTVFIRALALTHVAHVEKIILLPHYACGSSSMRQPLATHVAPLDSMCHARALPVAPPSSLMLAHTEFIGTHLLRSDQGSSNPGSPYATYTFPSCIGLQLWAMPWQYARKPCMRHYPFLMACGAWHHTNISFTHRSRTKVLHTIFMV